MTSSLHSVGPYDTAARAYELMREHRIRRLPVVQDGRLVGILTLSDLLALETPDPGHRRGVGEIAGELAKLVVGVVMTRDPVCVYASDTVGRAAELMLEHKVGGLPVRDADARLVGVVTESDLFRLLAESWRNDNLIFSGAR